MQEGFLSGLGGKLSESWFSTILTPAFFFWLGGLAAALSCDTRSLWSLWRGPWEGQLGQCQAWTWEGVRLWIASLDPTMQILAALSGFLLIATSGAAAQYFVLPLLRWAEGYWPGWLTGLRTSIVQRKIERSRQASQRWDELARAWPDDGYPGLKEMQEYRALDGQLSRVPTEYVLHEGRVLRVPLERAVMPTKLGDILSGAESRSEIKYGLNAIVCWSRLWLVLPDGVKSDLTDARGRLNSSVLLYFWSLVFLVWVIFAWWVLPVGLVIAFLAYQGVLAAATVFGELMDATFDTQRVLLYKALRWPLPEDPVAERPVGRDVTEYLWHGTLRPEPTFTAAASGEDDSS